MFLIVCRITNIPTAKRFPSVLCLKEENVSPDLDLVADVIDNIHSNGEPGKDEKNHYILG